MKFTYYDNSQGKHFVLFVYCGDSIEVADEAFEKQFGYHPMKKPSVAVTIEKE